MKKLLLLPLFATLMLSCSSDDDGGSTTPEEEMNCLDCESEGFDFLICDEGTFAEVTITNEDGTTDMEEIAYSADLNYEILSNLGCAELSSIYLENNTPISDPTDTCKKCTATGVTVDVCENEDGESYTVIYENQTASFEYEDNQTFESLTCTFIYEKGLELLN